MSWWMIQAGCPVWSGFWWAWTVQLNFGQAALRANSVFNFYLPDFVPSDTYFDQNRQTAPELQIQTDQALVEMNNKLVRMIHDGEVNKIQTLNNETLEVLASRKHFWGSELMMIDFDRSKINAHGGSARLHRIEILIRFGNCIKLVDDYRFVVEEVDAMMGGQHKYKYKYTYIYI